ncbi:MAG: branched-chain amino acid transport system substrate-binding protein [Solirubrobacteraceae bacterium]
MRVKAVPVVTGALCCVLAVAACGGGDGGSSSAGSGGAKTVTIGTSLPMTGPLGPFGPIIQSGYDQAVQQVNAAGGLKVGSDRVKIDLKVLDNKSDGNLAAQQARTLVLQDKSPALLGAVTPPLNIPMSNVAEQTKRPIVVTLTPVRAWLGARSSGWKYSWDAFFDEPQMTQLQFQTADEVQTNKKVALFTDTEEDGKVMGGLWEKTAPKFGYDVVYRAQFPVGTTDFGKYVAAAKSAGAEVLIAQMLPPDAFALWKQMKASGFKPKVAFCEKCANGGAWSKALGKVGDGTSVTDWWSPDNGYPMAKQFLDTYGAKFKVRSSDISIVVAAYTAARVLFDAIEKAGSLDSARINAAIGQTDKTYPVGPIKFDPDHHSAVKAVMTQWRGASAVQVYPEVKGAKVAAPVVGLK